jgi:hypothetical protein
LQGKSVKHNNFESSGAMVVCCTVEWHGPEYSSIIEQARKEDQIGVACLCELVFVGLAPWRLLSMASKCHVMFIGKAGAFLSAVPRWSHGGNEEHRFGGVGERGAVQCRHSFSQRTASPLHVHMIWAVGVGEELLLALLLFVSLHAPRFPCLPLMHCQHVVFPGLAALDIPSTYFF